ncbi:MAG TPA: hypothetical protein VGO11_26310 [Chthoniobacteraceae bacterium]|nr:hypothetical protein [Chthoniobacteraceae bacterium]
MKRLFVLRSSFFVCSLLLVCSLVVQANAAEDPKAKKQEEKIEPFRPEAGKFPPLDKALSYRGELVFVDHANRRGSLRVAGAGTYFRNPPHPFAMLPYGMVRYHGAPADLVDIPLGTVMYAAGYLPPDPSISAVPVLPVNNREKTAGYSGAGIAPAENHVLLLEDEPSRCQREGLVWKLKEVDVQNNAGIIVATCEPKAGGSLRSALTAAGDGKVTEEKLTFDAATCIWRGKERLSVAELVAEGAWPAGGKKSLDGQAVQLGICWKPTPDGIFTRFHISDIWLDDTAAQRSAELQTETHKAFIRSRWMPAWIDAVEYGKFGHATVTATLFGGMDAGLYADFQKGGRVLMNASENTLKHSGGDYGPAHMASAGTVVDVIKASGDVPMGSSGIQVRFETDLVIEGIRPTRVVRIRPYGWPAVQVPKEEYMGDGSNPEVRFPTPAIFPKY